MGKICFNLGTRADVKASFHILYPIVMQELILIFLIVTHTVNVMLIFIFFTVNMALIQKHFVFVLKHVLNLCLLHSQEG